jgi:hypothetical protein
MTAFDNAADAAVELLKNPMNSNIENIALNLFGSNDNILKAQGKHITKIHSSLFV